MSILDKLESERVVQFALSKDCKKLNVMELCDAWFEIALNKKQVEELITEITALKNQMLDPNS